MNLKNAILSCNFEILSLWFTLNLVDLADLEAISQECHLAPIHILQHLGILLPIEWGFSLVDSTKMNSVFKARLIWGAFSTNRRGSRGTIFAFMFKAIFNLCAFIPSKQIIYDHAYHHLKYVSQNPTGFIGLYATAITLICRSVPLLPLFKLFSKISPEVLAEVPTLYEDGLIFSALISGYPDMFELLCFDKRFLNRPDDRIARDIGALRDIKRGNNYHTSRYGLLLSKLPPHLKTLEFGKDLVDKTTESNNNKFFKSIGPNSLEEPWVTHLIIYALEARNEGFLIKLFDTIISSSKNSKYPNFSDSLIKCILKRGCEEVLEFLRESDKPDNENFKARVDNLSEIVKVDIAKEAPFADDEPREIKFDATGDQLS